MHLVVANQIPNRGRWHHDLERHDAALAVRPRRHRLSGAAAEGRRKGRVVSLEIMVPTPAIRNLIRDDKVHQIYGSMQAGQEKLGMQTANQSLASLYQMRLITLEMALRRHRRTRTSCRK